VNRIISAFGSGIRRVNGAPAVLAGVCVLTFLAALPLGLALREMIADSLDASAVAQAASWDPASVGSHAGFGSYAWWQHFGEQAVGVGRALSPSTVGFAAVLDNASSILDNRAHVLPVAVAGAGYALAWIFLSGGILDRYARNRRTRPYGFFAACGGYFFRLLRLATVAGLVYFVLFAWLHPLLFGRAWQSLTLDYTSESKAFALRAGLYVVFAAVLCLCNLLSDYAKVRIVVEDRRSVLAAIAAAVAFVRRRPGVVGLYLLDGCCYLLVIAVYALVAPGVRMPAWWTLLVGQAYVLARLWVKLLFYASETAFFQGALAHAGYTAAPPPSWPDSPAADAIIRS
jgi:hypothetical protein